MIDRIRFFMPIIVLLLSLLLMQWLISLREEPTISPATPYLPLVEVMEAKPSVYRHTVRSQGTVAPLGVIDLVPEVEGRVEFVSPQLRPGAFFSEGDRLLEIDPEDLDRAVTVARSMLRDAEVFFETEKARARVAREEWGTLEVGEASPLALREPQLALAQARQDAARARLQQAERNRARCRILAPFDGRVLEERVDVGQIIASGAPVARLHQTDRAEVVLPIRDADLAFLDLPLFPEDEAKDSSEHLPVTLTARFAGAERSWDGRVVRIEGELDPRTRLVRLVAEVERPFERTEGREVPLPAGLYVEAEITGRVVQQVFVFPRTAWHEGTQLLVVDENDRIELRTPKIERRLRDSIVVSAGVSEGERVVVSPLEAVVDRMPVRIRDDSPMNGDDDGGQP